MKISVITVAFNSVATIADTLASVAEQTYSHVEHLVIDGGSTDGTLELVRQRGLRVSQLVTAPDRGIYDAMNKGLRLAQGDFVGFLNADDVFASPQTMSTVVGAIAANPICPDAVYGDLQYVSTPHAEQVVRHWRSGAFTPSRLLFGWMPPHPTFYLRRSRLEAIGEFDLGFRIAADYDFMLRCLSQPGFRVAYIPEVLVRMRTGGASNRSLAALALKSREDLTALRKNKVGGVPTLLCKNFRKLPQFLGLT